MPKETFHNLPEQKKKKIFEAAVREFSEKRFSEASINQIIKNSGIPRGSFYQYFDGKEDLYMFVMKEIAKEKLEVVMKASAEVTELDFFESFEQYAKIAFNWARTRPLFYKIGMLMEYDNSEFIRKLSEASPDGKRMFIALIDKDIANGKIRKGVDPELIIEIVIGSVNSVMNEYFVLGSEDGTLDKLKAIFEILKGGIMND